MIIRSLIVVLVVSWSPLALGQGRSLHWSRLEVDATLDREGRLHVSERQAIVFNGDWNGGERRFRLGVGHKLTLNRISRIDRSGVAHPLRHSSALAAVDDYAWHDQRTLRWRSRLPSDPPFANREIIYLLEYTLENILKTRGDLYLLDQDFAFPDRHGVIEQFSLRLRLDEAWEPASAIAPRIEHRNLRSGQSVVLNLPLRYSSSARPAAVTFGVRREVGYGLAALFLLAFVALITGFVRSERARGRFEALIPPEQIDEAWLQENLLQHPAEVVGSAWDERTSAPEVAAVLARMTAEGKIRTRAETSGILLKRNELHLTLLVDRKELSGYEATLVRSLFFAGDQTSTELIRKHYKNKGFDPVAKIRKPVERMAQRLGSSGPAASRRRDKRWRTTLLLALAGVALLAATMLTPRQNLIVAAVAAGAIVLFYIIGIAGSEFFRSRVADFGPPAVTIVISLLLLACGVVFVLAFLPSILPLHLLLLAGVPLLALAAIRSILNWSRIRDDAERLELRRRLAAARNFFKHQLRERNPRLQDDWFPYLLAFGLGNDVDRWFRAFGGSSAVGPVSSSGSGAGSGSFRSSGGWTGGGGAFGGAGSSGSWAVAAGSLAAGVSAPSSGGSGGGGGGGGGSSGGGGGGGW